MKNTNEQNKWEENQNTKQKKKNTKPKKDGKWNIIGETKNDSKKKPEKDIIERKICKGGKISCGKLKPLSEFYKKKGMVDGHLNQCKKCIKEYNKQFHKQNYQENKEELKQISKQHYKENREEKIEYQKQYYQNNKEDVLDYQDIYYKENKDKPEFNQKRKQYREEHKEEILESGKQWRLNNPEKKKENDKKWREENPEKVKETRKKWKEKNKDKINEKAKKYNKEKRKTDPLFKLKELMRNMLRRTYNLIGTKKEGITVVEIGYSSEQLKLRLEMNLKPEFTWGNHGIVWEIDHTIPIDYFIKKGVKDQKIINALCNLRPLSCEENRSKGNKLIY